MSSTVTRGATVRHARPPLTALAVAGFLWTSWIAQPSIVFAFAVNWALMAAAYIVWLVMPLELGAGYYQPNAYERSGRIYATLGVRGFQRLLRRSGYYGRQRIFPSYQRGPDAADVLIAQTRGPETAHLLVFVVVAALTVDVAVRGWWSTAAWLVLFNVVLNAYPVLSMRDIRARVQTLHAPRGFTCGIEAIPRRATASRR